MTIKVLGKVADGADYETALAIREHENIETNAPSTSQIMKRLPQPKAVAALIAAREGVKVKIVF